ncbi:MAG TPA: glycosyl transferase family 2 [Cyanobacteria bacterium UBA11372]|nr:glycosyl transferase family 2 [Cyanobacteria bacterium UBA11372]
MNSISKGNMSLVSVIIPAYNAEKFIERTLKSVLSQTYKNIEVLVVDDGSQDRTGEIVKSIAAQDQRVILLQQSNSGVATARNLAIQKSKGEFIAPIDADDIWYPQNIEKQVQCILKSESSVGLVYSWSVDIDEADSPIGEFRASRIEGEVYTTLLCHDFIANASSVLIRRSCFDKVRGYDRSLKEQNGQGCEDWDLYLRIAEHYHFRVVPEFLVGYRKLANSMSGDYTSMAKSRELIWKSIREKYPNIPAAIYRLSTSSFYMNLARQSSLHGKHKTTLFWIYKSLEKEKITPFLRLGFYILLIKSLLKLMAQPVTGLIWQEDNAWVNFKQKFKSNKQPITITDLNNRQLNTNFKVLAESTLHRLAPMIFGTPKTWLTILKKENGICQPINEP